MTTKTNETPRRQLSAEDYALTRDTLASLLAAVTLLGMDTGPLLFDAGMAVERARGTSWRIHNGALHEVTQNWCAHIMTRARGGWADDADRRGWAKMVERKLRAIWETL